MAANWLTHVKPRVEAEIDELKDRLVTASLDDVHILQARVIALQSVLKWFDDGTPRDRQISSNAPISY